MPISKHNRSKYLGGSIQSPEWRELRDSILERADNRCECTCECGTDHRRDIKGKALDRRCHSIVGGHNPQSGHPVQLGIAHMDNDPTNNDPTNLKAMCRRCHNMLDQPHRTKSARRNRKWAKRYAR